MPEYQTGYNEILPEGVYDFVVVDANECRSKSSGNEMIALELLVRNGNTEIKVYDQLVFTSNSLWKIDAFRAATGEKLVPGQTVNIDAFDLVERAGKCVLTVEKYQGRDKNKVQEYLGSAAENPLPRKQRVASAQEESEPF